MNCSRCIADRSRGSVVLPSARGAKKEKKNWRRGAPSAKLCGIAATVPSASEKKNIMIYKKKFPVNGCFHITVWFGCNRHVRRICIMGRPKFGFLFFFFRSALDTKHAQLRLPTEEKNGRHMLVCPSFQLFSAPKTAPHSIQNLWLGRATHQKDSSTL